jgi:hypothetical protein
MRLAITISRMKFLCSKTNHSILDMKNNKQLYNNKNKNIIENKLIKKT